MTALAERARVARQLPTRFLPVVVTFALFVLMFAGGSLRYESFASGQVLLNLLIDNSFLVVLAVGMTFVILTGGIDLSVGSVVALSTMVAAALLRAGWPPAVVMLLVLAGGAVFGLAMGAVIHYLEIQPFIVTLAGMFLARGLCYVIDLQSISITDPLFRTFAQTAIPLGDEMFLSPSALVALVVVAVAAYVLHMTRFGRTVYAVGGNQQSAMLMGLRVAQARVGVYVISGACSALAGLLFTFYMLSGYSLHAVGMELDAIAAVVIGGTLLAGGSGFVLGSVLGVLVLGTIQTILSFEGTLSSWWSRIVIGLLLLVFVVLQRMLARRTAAG
ncbi:monosaccharide ABC transporter membrane protein (CUT2 family) [Pseudonocardia hierapolitana]|uniref:Monosaccharide ABC transporter membrane protein (CUT2 family) n=1 Tax=Pseudonocardia hierapolitana TaxID=1128676 RepID=A0A561T459_9PSEU|nr:galactofuranose ABC transporter, permease protein YjfF [Pseudonocardia hierapolitana]TWF81882.1 monosaccharide ABC transporter membrane protein (CUT2 family) [Pseudonocardia hierapolitana]